MKTPLQLILLGLFLVNPSLICAQNVEGLIRRGDELLFNKEYKTAQKVFSQALRVDSKSSESHRGLGDALYYSRTVRRVIEKAQTEYKKALELNQSNLRAQYGLAQCHLSFGEYDQALSTAKKVLDADPTFADAQLTIAETYHRIARDRYYTEGMEKVIEEYRKVLEIDPDHVRATDSLGVEYVRMREYAKAISLWENYVTKYPGDSNMVSRLAWVYWLDQQFDRAIDYGQTAQALNPKNKRAKWWIESAQKSKAEKQHILDLTYEILTDLAATGSPIERQISRQLLDGQTENTIAAMKKRLIQDDKDGLANFFLALSSVFTGDKEGASSGSAKAIGFEYKNKRLVEFHRTVFQYELSLSPVIR